jgi:hypothetical protein
VTHAFLTAINEDRRLLDGFLSELVGVKAPTTAERLSVLEQQYPGEDELGEAEAERRGIPDGWVFDSEGWCVLIESKLMARLTRDQIERHRRTAARRGFRLVTLVAIAPRAPAELADSAVVLEWRSIYAWLRRQAGRSAWAARAAAYLEIAEAKLIEAEQLGEGTLTMFAGFPFGEDHPFTYLEGKRLLGLAMGELRKRGDLRELGMNPRGAGRPAITGRNEDRVWDLLPLAGTEEAGSFTSHPHLTLGVLREGVEAMVTVPHAVNRAMRANIAALGLEGFEALARQVLERYRPLLRRHPGAVPYFRGVQRRYPSQRARPFVDARIEFDLRTAIAGSGAPKAQPRWLQAAYGAFVNKEGSNYQMQVGAQFRYGHCPALRSEEQALEMIAAAWIGCAPLVALSGMS